MKMDEEAAFNKYLCPFMSASRSLTHCTYYCRFYNSLTDGCVIRDYMFAMTLKTDNANPE